MDLEHFDSLILLHPEQIIVVRDDGLGTRFHRALHNPVVVGIGYHDIESLLRIHQRGETFRFLRANRGACLLTT